MKAITSLGFGIASSVCVCIGAASVASLVLAEPTEPLAHRITSSPDLWTATPIRIDPNQQNYERLPAVYSTYVTIPLPVKVAAGKPLRTSASPVANAVVAQFHLPPTHVDWCSSRYRSYDPATNTYRSFSGQVRRCTSPYANDDGADNHTAQVNPRFVGYGMENLHTAWCTARYRSYRADDNTYQPYDGPRRPCLSASQETRLEASNQF
ncbi:MULTISPECIES: BA14K family protein [unclassified Rhizobium]|uniref:BA14K family protein n=1 Tax=unclassified Rhizobium TaxID=2613769 RepID=UPI0006F36473|nr:MULTISPECIES: BA14K family protein [unclassified Rhizobium]KQV40012.1 hypothetical protein ASC86_22525 [Rhizobium sp. Root1212]KRD31722.1 hypothetical protein ASE37_23570 [Rhizobium sp. Root268]